MTLKSHTIDRRIRRIIIMSTTATGRFFNTKPSPWQPLNQGKRSAARKRILDGGGGGSAAAAAAATSPSSGTIGTAVGPAHKHSTLSSLRAELASAAAAPASGAGAETPTLSSAVTPPATAHVRRRSSFDDSMYSDRQLRRNSLLSGAGGEPSPARPPGHDGK